MPLVGVGACGCESLCIFIFTVCAHLIGNVYMQVPSPSLLFFFLSASLYVCVVLLPVCLSACAPFNWRSLLNDPASHTQRQLERWIIWAVSGPVSLWALLYIHCGRTREGKKKREKKRICINSRRAPAACTADKAQSRLYTSWRSGTTLHHSAI